MRKQRRSLKMMREGGELRLEHLQVGDWKASAVMAGCIFFLPCLMAIPWLLWADTEWWVVGVWVVLYGLTVALFASDVKGEVRVGNGEFVVRGWGAIRPTGDTMRWEEVEALEWTEKRYPVPGEDESVLPGLHAVSGERRVCLAPNVREDEARQIVEEILKVAPSLRGKVL